MNVMRTAKVKSAPKKLIRLLQSLLRVDGSFVNTVDYFIINYCIFAEIRQI